MRVLIGDIEVDATVSERHVSTVELTRHPVEQGASPADHARQAPERITIEGVISNTSTSALEQVTKRGGVTRPGEGGWARSQLEALRAMVDARKVLVVTTAARTFRDMMIVSLEVPRDARTGDAFRFSISLEQVRFVTTESVQLQGVPKPKDQTKPTKKDEQPKKTPQETTDAVEVDSSWWKTINDGLGWSTPGSGL